MMTGSSLRPYQRKALAAVKAEIDAGNRRTVLVAPTGAGKTHMGAAAACARVARGQRIVWAAHRTELVDQAVASLRAWGLDVGARGRNVSAPVQVISTQGSLKNGEVPPADLLVLDECHHYSADDWKRLPEAYPDADILGLTATPERADGRPLDHLFNAIVVAAQFRELVDLGFLVPCSTYRPSRQLRKGMMAAFPVDALIEHKLVGKRTVVFAKSISDAETFVAQFREKGISAAIVHGSLPKEERKRALDDLRSGAISVVVNVFVLTEGFDCPSIEVVIMARQCGSQSMLIQSVGRGLRVSPGKLECHFIDLCGVTHTLGDPMEDREFSLDGEGIKCGSASVSQRYCRTCGEPLPDGEMVCQCGSASTTIFPTATGDRLEKFSRIRLDNIDQRVSRLTRWIGDCLKANPPKKWQSALYRYRGTYGATPTPDIVSKALAAAKGVPFCESCKHSKKNCECERMAKRNAKIMEKAMEAE